MNYLIFRQNSSIVLELSTAQTWRENKLVIIWLRIAKCIIHITNNKRPYKIISSNIPRIFTVLVSNSQSSPSNKNSASRIHKIHCIPILHYCIAILAKKINRKNKYVEQSQKTSDNKQCSYFRSLCVFFLCLPYNIFCASFLRIINLVVRAKTLQLLLQLISSVFVFNFERE